MNANQLFFGDNLQVLRDSIADESVDLIYLDPPFNSKRDYNLLFKTPKAPKVVKTGKAATELTAEEDEPEPGYGDAQITAFEDTWHWGQQAADEFREILQSPNTNVAELMQALRSFLKENDMLAYLTAMCIRLLELHRVLKPTGSLYLHCDPTASHYLKIVLDGVFGPQHFQNEIIWRRTGSHNAAKRYGPIHDTILFVTKSARYTYNNVLRPYMRGHVESRYKLQADGRYRFSSGGNVLTGAGVREGVSGAAWRQFNPTAKARHWAIPSFYEELMPAEYATGDSLQKLEALFAAGLVEIVEGNEWPSMVRFLSERDGTAVQDIWAYQPYTEGTVVGTEAGIDADVRWYGPTDPDRLGYPTQKPTGLLERIVRVSSNEGDVVLDPFCGCGTAVHAAQKLNRRWIGIDITHLAVGLIERRLKEAFPGIAFDVHGTPTDMAAARDLAERDKHQFQLWACGLVNAQPYQGGRKGADRGIDGLLYIELGKNKTEKVIVQVKGGNNVSRANIATLKGDVDREKAAVGLFITLAEPTREMLREASAAGHFETPHHGALPKIQILTIEELLSGKRPQLPDLSRGEQTFKKAKREERDGKKAQTGLDF